jgi:hypothetical protein
MRCLVGCEFSGVVRDAFAAKGWDAWSCDLLPSDRPGNHFEKIALENPVGILSSIIRKPDQVIQPW